MRRKNSQLEDSPTEDYWKHVGSPLTTAISVVLFIVFLAVALSLFHVGEEQFQGCLYMCIMVLLAMITIVLGSAIKDIGRIQAKIRDDVQIHNRIITSILTDMSRDNKRNIGIMDDIRSKISAEQEEYVTSMNIAEMLVPELSPDFLRQYATDFTEEEGTPAKDDTESSSERDEASPSEDTE